MKKLNVVVGVVIAMGMATGAFAMDIPENGSVFLDSKDMPYLTVNLSNPNGNIECGVQGQTRVGYVKGNSAALTFYVPDNNEIDLSGKRETGLPVTPSRIAFLPGSPICRLVKKLNIRTLLAGETSPWNPEAMSIFSSPAEDQYGGKWNISKVLFLKEGADWNAAHPAMSDIGNYIIAEPNFKGYVVKFRDGKVAEVSLVTGNQDWVKTKVKILNGFQEIKQSVGLQ